MQVGWVKCRCSSCKLATFNAKHCQLSSLASLLYFECPPNLFAARSPWCSASHGLRADPYYRWAALPVIQSAVLKQLTCRKSKKTSTLSINSSMPTFDPARFLTFVLLFLSRDLEVPGVSEVSPPR